MSNKEFFSFDTVVDFDKHIKDQILEYPALDTLVQDIAINFLEDNTNVYDLGCSTGRMVKELAVKYPDKKVEYLGIESNPNFTNDLRDTSNVTFLNRNLREPMIFTNASLVLSIFTLQFTGEQNRQRLLRDIYRGLNRGGGFIIAEKVYCGSARLHKIVEMHNWDLKRKRYTPAEVLADEKDLRDVMKPLTLADNLSDLQQAGFTEIELVWRFNNFVLGV